MKIIVKILVVLVLFCQMGRAQGYVEAVTTNRSVNIFSQNIVGFVHDTVGWTFSPTQNIEVSGLGMLGRSSTDGGEIGLWAADGTLLRSTALDDNNQNINGNFYEAIDPILLSANMNYVIGVGSSGQILVAGPGNSPTDSSIQYINAIDSAPHAGFAFPDSINASGTADGDIVGPTFLFEPVPEPGMLSLCALGGLFLAFQRRRK